MDRRKFLWSSGAAAGSVSAAAGAWLVRDGQSASARVTGLQKAAGALQAPTTGGSATRSAIALNHGISLGYLVGSANLFTHPSAASRAEDVRTMPGWLPWDRAAPQTGMGLLFKRSSSVYISIGSLQRSSPLSHALQGLEITAHFAIDEAPYFAEFGAWSYRVSSSGNQWTQPLTFTAEVPDRVALGVNYALDPAATAGGTRGAGSLYLPIGPDGSLGLSTGLYVLASASLRTGVAPDFSAWMFSGNYNAPIVGGSGDQPDFDYLAIAIRPVAL